MKVAFGRAALDCRVLEMKGPAEMSLEHPAMCDPDVRGSTFPKSRVRARYNITWTFFTCM